MIPTNSIGYLMLLGNKKDEKSLYCLRVLTLMKYILRFLCKILKRETTNIHPGLTKHKALLVQQDSILF